MTTHTYRRAAFLSQQPPSVGTLIASKSGKTVLRVTKSSVLRRYGEPASRDTIRLELDKVLPADLSSHVEPSPWPIVARKILAPREQAALRFKIPESKVPVLVQTTSKSRKQKKRDAARARRVVMIDHESLIPRAQLDPVLDATGAVVCEPKVMNGDWRDPEDRNMATKTPRLIYGSRRTDPLIRWARGNREVTAQHICAADHYRLAWELGPGGAIASGRDLTYSDRSFSPSTGIAEVRCQRMANWTWVQGQLSDAEKLVLEDVVLCRMPVTAWAYKHGVDRRRAVRGLIKALDHLYDGIYKDDVDASIKTEGSVLD